VSTRRFSVVEATVASVHAALASGETTCVNVVRACLDRIEAFDRKGPALRAILTVNPRALQTAAEMDGLRARGAPLPPLHGIPLVLKDNFDTADLPTTGGAVTLADAIPPRDAFVVSRLREAGAIVIGKANQTELALNGSSVSSLGGQTLNPYDLTRTPGGSSGGTGAAIAASFAVLGTGSDTGQSIRSPASACALVGVRPTRGLVSRRGVMPFSPTQDEVGPITRTVEDAARMLDVMAGYDPEDAATALGVGRAPASYRAALGPDALHGVRLGLLESVMGTADVHQPVNAVMRDAVAHLEALGATVVPVEIPGLDRLTRDLSLMRLELAAAFDTYLASLGDRAPVRTLAQFVARGEFHPSLRADLEAALQVVGRPATPEHAHMCRRRDALRDAVQQALDAQALHGIVYPHQRRLAVPVGEEQVDRNGVLSNSTGYPAVVFPAGFAAPTATAPIGVPVGMEVLGPAWSEGRLLAFAYAFEQGVGPRRTPLSTPSVAHPWTRPT
jgi:amidase